MSLLQTTCFAFPLRFLLHHIFSRSFFIFLLLFFSSSCHWCLSNYDPLLHLLISCILDVNETGRKWQKFPVCIGLGVGEWLQQPLLVRYARFLWLKDEVVGMQNFEILLSRTVECRTTKLAQVWEASKIIWDKTMGSLLKVYDYWQRWNARESEILRYSYHNVSTYIHQYALGST